MTPNVIHVVAHDLGRDLGCYQRPVHSPVIDRFANTSYRFTAAHATAVCCSPSRACAMTGLYPHRNGVMGLAHRGWAMPRSTRTLVDWLNDARIETIHSGFQHERMAYAENRYAVELSRRTQDHLSQNAIELAIDHLVKRANTDTPFYLNVGTLETHPSVWDVAACDGQVNQLQLEQFERYAAFDDGSPEASISGEDYPRTYRAAIGFFDHAMATLFDAIDRLNLNDNTWVVLTTDHGAAFGERRKSTLYELGTEIAMLIRPPGGLTRPQRIDEPVPNVDMAPTLADLMGVTPPSGLDGQSFARRLRGEPLDHDRSILGFRTHHGIPVDDAAHEVRRSLRQGRCLLIWRPAIPGRSDELVELYDTLADPACAFDLSENPSHHATANAMRHRLKSLLVDSGDPVVAGRLPENTDELLADAGGLGPGAAA